MAQNQVLGACIARGSRVAAGLVGDVAGDLRRAAVRAIERRVQPLLGSRIAPAEERCVVEVGVVEIGDLTARAEWANGRAALDSFLVDLGTDGLPSAVADRPARWTVGDTTTEVGLVYGTPVISITSVAGAESMSIRDATLERLRAAHGNVGRAVRLA